jgi:hypothetical protein
MVWLVLDRPRTVEAVTDELREFASPDGVWAAVDALAAEGLVVRPS